MEKIRLVELESGRVLTGDLRLLRPADARGASYRAFPRSAAWPTRTAATPPPSLRLAERCHAWARPTRTTSSAPFRSRGRCVRPETAKDYEANTGLVIAETFRDKEPGRDSGGAGRASRPLHLVPVRGRGVQQRGFEAIAQMAGDVATRPGQSVDSRRPAAAATSCASTAPAPTTARHSRPGGRHRLRGHRVRKGRRNISRRPAPPGSRRRHPGLRPACPA